MSIWPEPQPERVTVYSNLDDVQMALGRIGVPLTALMQALQEGRASLNSRTPHDAPTAWGFYQWNETLRSLTDSLVPQEWVRSDDCGWPNLVHPQNLLAIAISTGDLNVGNPEEKPSTKFSKGKKTEEAVQSNASQLTLLPDFDKHDEQVYPVYFLLYVLDDGELRSELSLPIEINASGFITEWRERIILPTIPGDDFPVIPVIPEPDFGPDIDIDITRRA